MKNTMRRFIAVLLAIMLLLAMTACGGKEKAADSLNIAIVKQMDHPSLDEIAAAIAARLDAIAAEQGITIEYDVYSGGRPIIHIHKEWISWGDTYIIDIENPEDELMGLMLVVAIDAANCDHNNN